VNRTVCGRFKLTIPFAELVALYKLTLVKPDLFENAHARYNVAPMQTVAVIRYDPETKKRLLEFMRWGLQALGGHRTAQRD
jgi:putative SOS response-associated peptidase YedK